MQNWPMTLNKVIDHAATWHPTREVVTRSPGGPILTTTYGQIRQRAKQVSNALKADRIHAGDRVATLAFNSSDHLEAWYGIIGIGAVCHTLNPRLFPEQIVYIINHAEDRMILADGAMAPLLRQILPNCPTVKRIVTLYRTGAPSDGMVGVDYDDWIAGHSTDCDWGQFDEGTAAGLCYTSGTTGNPKGVLYSHRSNYLHMLVALQADAMGISARDTVLAMVPMFHANAWGLTFTAPAVGAKLVLPGAKMDGASVLELIEKEGVTMSAGVPTVWQTLLQHLDATRIKRITTLKKILVGGSACPESILRAFSDRFGIEVLQLWGMTEMSPLGSIGGLEACVSALPADQQILYRVKQGRPMLGVEMKLTDDESFCLQHDGRICGRLKVRGHSVAREYFQSDGIQILDEEGFFDTGDVATIDEHGYMQITDRRKDLIKSGGEWISSIHIENIAAGHPKSAIVAVIGIPHPKWGERPLLVVQMKPGVDATRDEFLDYFSGKIAKWWTPDDVVFMAAIPIGPTGKIDKKLIRQRLEGYRFTASTDASC